MRSPRRRQGAVHLRPVGDVILPQVVAGEDTGSMLATSDGKSTSESTEGEQRPDGRLGHLVVDGQEGTMGFAEGGPRDRNLTVSVTGIAGQPGRHKDVRV